MNKNFTVGLIFLLGITLSVITYWTVKHQLNIHKNLEFKWTASEHYRAFHKQLKRDINALELHKILDVFQLEKQNDFKLFSKLILKQHKSIQSLYWLPGNIINTVKTNSNNKTKLSSLFSYAEPVDVNFVSLNEDLDFGSNFHKTLEQARDSGKVIINKLFPENNVDNIQNGIIGLSPVYKPDEPTTSIEHRRQNLIGFVMGIFLFNDLFEVSIGHLEPRGIDIFLLNKTSAKKEQLLHHYKSRISRSDDSMNHNLHNYLADDTLKFEKKFTITDQHWLLIGKATPEFRSAEAFNQGPAIALLTGIIFTIFIVVYFYNLSKAKDAWQTAERKLHTVLDNSPDYIIIVAKNNMISYMNKPLFGLEPETSIGQSFFDWLPAQYNKRYKEGLDKAFEEKKTDSFNYSLADLSHWDVRILPIRTKGKISSAMVINTDITKQHKLKIQTMEHSRLATIGVLATGVAHEINNPNNAIQSSAALYERVWKDAMAVLKEYYHDQGDFSLGGLSFAEEGESLGCLILEIRDNSLRIKAIVENLKHLGKNDQGELNEEININAVLRAAAGILKNNIRKYTNHWIMELDDDLPLVKGNFQQLEQVFINIMLNALQSLPDCEHEVRIKSVADPAKSSLLIQIMDQGIGIADEDLSRLTEPFFTTRLETGGTGLGLSISSTIIENHHGSIDFKSSKETGTLVTLKLPIIDRA